MKTYEVTFEGRKKGAIGIRYTITDVVQAMSEQDAELALYDKYEHISGARAVELVADPFESDDYDRLGDIG